MSGDIFDMNNEQLDRILQIFRSKISESQKKILVVFDMNNVLVKKERRVFRVEGTDKIQRHVATQQGEFILKKLFDSPQKYDIAIWSSGLPKNVYKILEATYPKYIDKFKFIWTQNECKILENKINPTRPILSKPVQRIMEAYPEYENRIFIVDDTIEKMRDNDRRNYIIIDNLSKLYELEQIIEIKNDQLKLE